MRIHNTLTGRKEEFILQGDVVRMYVCGVTPYDECHIGHAMSYIFFDVLRRYLEFRGYRVKHVQNFTDVDDKIISRAHQKGIPAAELAQGFIERYFEDMDALNIQRATHYPQATQVMPEILGMVKGLVAKGYAYPVGGDVYFRVQRFPGYGKLSHRTLEGMQAGARLDIAEAKEHPMDFTLWKAAKPGEPSWESPWGLGRPGWHIECSAMSLKYLGETLDIHGGGQDLIFPHHENETAQSEAFTGVVPFVRYWIHNGMVQLGSEKMSKSLGNLVTVREVLEKYSADAIRIFILGSHYRSPLTYSEVTLQATEVALRVFSNAKWKLTEPYSQMNRSMLEGRGIKTDDITSAKVYRNRFTSAMDDDFNTAQALAALFDLAQEINRAVNLGHENKVVEHREIFKELADVLGLKLKPPEEQIGGLATFEGLQTGIAQTRGDKLRSLLNEIENVAKNPAVDIRSVEGYINLVLGVRDSLRRDKKFQLADEIRTQLSELGIVLEDTPSGTLWRYRR